MNEPRGTGSLFRLAIARLFGLVSGPTEVADELVPTFDMFARPELWALSQGSLWNLVQPGPAAGGVGFRSRVGVVLPTATKNVLSIVELVRLNCGAAGQQVQIGLTVPDASTLLGLTHRDVRRANNGLAGIQSGIATRGYNVNGTPLPSPVVVTETVRLLANTSVDVPVSYVLEPGSSLFVAAAADNAALGVDVILQGRERSATDEEIQM